MIYRLIYLPNSHYLPTSKEGEVEVEVEGKGKGEEGIGKGEYKNDVLNNPFERLYENFARDQYRYDMHIQRGLKRYVKNMRVEAEHKRQVFQPNNSYSTEREKKQQLLLQKKKKKKNMNKSKRVEQMDQLSIANADDTTAAQVIDHNRKSLSETSSANSMGTRDGATPLLSVGSGSKDSIYTSYDKSHAYNGHISNETVVDEERENESKEKENENDDNESCSYSVDASSLMSLRRRPSTIASATTVYSNISTPLKYKKNNTLNGMTPSLNNSGLISINNNDNNNNNNE
ncbi:hypothetical protein ACO0QE_004168 [Hanseniaspora vineae]